MVIVRVSLVEDRIAFVPAISNANRASVNGSLVSKSRSFLQLRQTISACAGRTRAGSGADAVETASGFVPNLLHAAGLMISGGLTSRTPPSAFASEVTFAAGYSSRSSRPEARTRASPRSPSPSRARGPDHGLGRQDQRHPAHRDHHEEHFDQTPTLNPRESAHCRVNVDFPASPTDDAMVS
jgi:hypothetical protein